MKMTGNTILVTGGNSGIGRALAEAFHKLGNQVIVTGRRRDALATTIAANPGMQAMALDMSDHAAIKNFATEITRRFPALNIVLNNAGIMRSENLKAGDTEAAEAIIATNLLGPIRLTAALMPHLLGRSEAAVMNVSSGLAFVPLALSPTYSASKAAIHSYTQAMRQQLRQTSVKVFELIPPAVATDLMPISGHEGMPLKDFIAEVMQLLATQPEAEEIVVEQVKPLRFAEAQGQHAQMFAALSTVGA